MILLTGDLPRRVLFVPQKLIGLFFPELNRTMVLFRPLPMPRVTPCPLARIQEDLKKLSGVMGTAG
jgi:hypothetical protein